MANYTKCLISHTEKEIIVEFFSEEGSIIRSLRTDAGKHPVSSNTFKKEVIVIGTFYCIDPLSE